MLPIREGKRVEVRPDSKSESWIDCYYLMPVPDLKGWHYVKNCSGSGDRYAVPTRRIRVRI